MLSLSLSRYWLHSIRRQKGIQSPCINVHGTNESLEHANESATNRSQFSSSDKCTRSYTKKEERLMKRRAICDTD